MPPVLHRVLIPLTDIENREFLISADHIISFRSAPSPDSRATSGNNTYIIQMSNGSEITLLKEQCDRIINSKLFTINKTKAIKSPGTPKSPNW